MPAISYARSEPRDVTELPYRDSMTDCATLRSRLQAAKAARNQARVANAQAKDEGRPVPHSAADLEALMLGVDVAALEARRAGCDIDDLVGPNVGRLD